jgi:hypothetical protein
MIKAKCLGIWMDHANAHLIDCTNPEKTATIESTAAGHPEDGVDKGEKQVHHKEQNQLSAYYKKLGEAIKNYDEVLLFGPTTAKVELLNSLHADAHFANIKIEVKQADKMTENQQHAFVRDHFSNN